MTGAVFQKVKDNFIQKKYEKFFQNIFFDCMNVEKFSYLGKNNNKIKDVYDNPKLVFKFIEDVSSGEINEFPYLKLISYSDYKDKYHERHENISQFYGNLTKELYDKYNKKMESYNDSNKEDIFNKLIIQEYNTFYKTLNKCLNTFAPEFYEIISYYTERVLPISTTG